MLAITHTENQYHYLNWIPSESGPLVTNYGNIKKELKDPENYKQHNYEILYEIISTIEHEELICTFSLDVKDLIFSTCYVDSDNANLFNWYQLQVKDSNLVKSMDYFHYPLKENSSQQLSIAVPKMIRQSLKYNMKILKARLNGISAGIFSAASGARHWLHADKLDSYIIWKIGKKQKDEILFINNNHLESYFSITRSLKKIIIIWQFGNKDIIDNICQYIETLINNNHQIKSPASKIFIYTCNGKIQDVKDFEKKGKKNIILLNPLSVLKMTEIKKINIYDTLALAETGNAFGNIDV